MGQMRVRRTGPWVKISCPFSWVQFIRRVGHGVGQVADPHFDPHRKVKICNKKTPEIRRFQVFRGAAGRIRTADLILTKDALYLLSYSSIKWRPGTGSNRRPLA